VSVVRDVFQGFGVALIAYFIALSLIYLAFTLLSWRSLTRYLRSRAYAEGDDAMSSPLTPPISVLLPAYNEAAGIVDSVRSLLALRYPHYEVVVINDGSTDRTLELLREAFDLRPARLALRQTLAHAPTRGTYLSAQDPKLIVVDKDNGGKADALNCGIVTATFPYFCAVDGDSLIEEEALLQVAQPVFDDPKLVVATGGIVRIANGCRVDHGRVVEVGLPRARLAALQVVEYFRAFLVGRVAWSDLRAMLIISGAFGLFKRSVVESAGGYWTQTVGEDAELVMRVHRHMREQGRDYRVDFVADPVCWTEAPEDVRTLQGQRRRWQRGLVETLWRHRRVVGNPRYGALGLMAAPYFVLFELVGPVVAVFGYVLLPIAALLGLISIDILIAFVIVAFLFGILLSVAALALEEFSFRRHARHGEAGRLLLYAMVDNLGYRQMTEAFQLRGLIDVVRRRTGWGEMKRLGVGR